MSSLPTNIRLVKAMVFLVFMYGCDSWTIKKAKCRRIDAFELWCWRRLLRVPWTARRPNQPTLKKISPEYSLEGLMLKLKLRYFGHLMWRTDSLEKTLMLGKIEGRGRRGRQRMRWRMASPTQWTWVWASSQSWWWTGKCGVLQSMWLQRVIGHDWMTKLNWNSLNETLKYFFFNRNTFFIWTGKILCFYLFFFFFPPIIFISWRLITLQYCSSFCHTLIWISHGFTWTL